MAFNSHFLLSKSATSNIFSLLDDSTGSDANLTNRLVSVYDYTGAAIISNVSWPIADETQTFDILSTDKAINVSVFWVSSDPDPDPSTYTYSQIYAMLGYSEDFYYRLTQRQTSEPNIINDNNYYYNKMKLRVEMDSALQAISVGEDIAGSQGCIIRALYLEQNYNFFF